MRFGIVAVRAVVSLKRKFHWKRLSVSGKTQRAVSEKQSNDVKMMPDEFTSGEVILK
jgi:hypothetical protein